MRPSNEAASTAATEELIVPTGKLRRLLSRLPGGQFFRYLVVGVFNTVFGYSLYVLFLTLLNHAMPARLLYLAVVLASVLSTPINISVAYFGYKFFVFKTKGNYLREWAKCFAVYGTGMLPGLFTLSALARLLQSLFHRYAFPLHAALLHVQSHLSGPLLTATQHAATGRAMAGYVAGAITTGCTTIFSFIGHRKVTFKARPAEA